MYCTTVVTSKRAYCNVQNACRVDLAGSREVSQVLFKKGENFVKGDCEIVSGLHE
jgi:hypothetical protein